MRAPATPFFRDVRMPSQIYERHAHERFLLDTLAERRAHGEEKPRSWLREFAARAFRPS